MQFGLMHGCQYPQRVLLKLSSCEQAWSAASKKVKRSLCGFAAENSYFSRIRLHTSMAVTHLSARLARRVALEISATPASVHLMNCFPEDASSAS
jgi:hypothetical protein